MKYLCLVYLSADSWNACSDSACAAYAGQLKDSGKLLEGSPLHSVDTATTVRVRNGQMAVTETKEALAGFYMIEARDLNEAIQIAAKIPPAKHGSIEVRPTRELAVDPVEVERYAAAAAP